MTDSPLPVALLLPGQGSQFSGMATELYGWEPAFTAAMDEVLALMGPDAEQIRSDWLGHTAEVGIDDVRRAQPLLFALDYALARMLHSWGVRPTALLGHSAGELVAATLAGVFTLADAVRSQLDRVRLATLIPSGGMLAVAATEAELRPFLVGDVAIAAVNAARQTMLAGSVQALAEVEQRLRADDFTVAVVPATSPFHSPAMAPAARAAEVGLAAITLRPPTQTVYSGYTGRILQPKEATDPGFWARQVVDTVYFGPALDALLDAGDRLLVETGPGQTLTAFARRHRAVRSGRSKTITLLPGCGEADAQRRSIEAAAALLRRRLNPR